MSDVEVREELGKLHGKRLRFKAKVGRFGSKSNYKTGFPEKTVLLLNVIDVSTGQQTCDHLWFTVRKRLEALELQEGDEITFDARVSFYRKFHRGNEGRESNFHYRDYKLSYPTNLKKTILSSSDLHSIITEEKQ